jgi:hypothetical protein
VPTDSGDEYNPLDYDNLTRNCVQELMRRGPYRLDFSEPFTGAGVYALFYAGNLDIYRPISSPKATWPIYVGKAVPPGARKGAKSEGPSKALYLRLREHRDSISEGKGIRPEEFMCRYLAVTPLWITMAERLLIEKYQPVWNVCIEGFGLHDPGKGRHAGQRSWWDVLHPGRSWAERLVNTRSNSDAAKKVKGFLKNRKPGSAMPPLRQDPDLFMQDED